MNPIIKSTLRFVGNIALDKVLDGVENRCESMIKKNVATKVVWYTTRAVAVYSPKAKAPIKV